MCLSLVWSGASQLSETCENRSGLSRKIILTGVPRQNASTFNFSLFTGTFGGPFLFGLEGSYSPGQFFPLGNMPVTLTFMASGGTADTGFRVSFYIGETSPGKYKTNCGL